MFGDHGLEHLVASFAVLDLAAFGLAARHDSRRQVRHAHGRVRLVDILTTSTATAVGIHTNVGHVQVEFHVFVFRVQVHGGKARVAAGVRVKGADAHQTVHADFRTEQAVSVFASDFDGSALEAGIFRFLEVHHLEVHVFAFEEMRIHAEEHQRPVLRLGAACARVNRHQAAAGIIGAVQHLLEFHRLNLRLEFSDIGINRCRQVGGFFRLAHFIKFGEVVARLRDFFPRVQQGAQIADLFHHGLRLVLVIPQVRVGGVLFQNVKFFGLCL